MSVYENNIPDKKPRLDCVKTEPQLNALDLTSSPTILSTIHLEPDIHLNQIKFIRILKECPYKKEIIIEGEYGGDKVVVIFEKTPFTSETVDQFMTKTDKSLEKLFTNGIYGNYTAFPQPEFNGIKTIIIHPATENHILKYVGSDLRIIQETPEKYRKITLPHFESNSLGSEWIDDILNHKAEKDRIIFEDTDKTLGFVLVPGSNWDCKSISDLHLVAIIRRKDLRSIRDLNSKHLSLIKNIRDKSVDAIKIKYGLEADRLRIFFHYRPTFYHLHIHFTNIKALSHPIERAHLLDSVINNIQLLENYYQLSTIPMGVLRTDPLYEKLNDSNST